MRRIEYRSKAGVSAKAHSYGKYSAVSRYEDGFEDGRVSKKLSAGKGDSSRRAGFGDLKETSSGAVHISKGVFRESTRLKAVRTTAAAASPLATGTIVGAVAAGFYGVGNMIRYARNEKTGVQAAKDTATGSAGVGLSTGLGLAAARFVAGSSLAFGSTVIAPLVAGAAVGYASMAIWDKFFYKGKCSSKTK